MIDSRMQAAINDQINWELYSGYLYLSMAAQFAALGMPGGQNWMTVQYQEELAHAQKMFDYVTTRGGRVKLEAIDRPQTEWAAGLDMFKEALAHEEIVTSRIHDLASLALEIKDHATYNFLELVHRRAGRGGRDGRRHGAEVHDGRGASERASTSWTRSCRRASTRRPRRQPEPCAGGPNRLRAFTAGRVSQRVPLRPEEGRLLRCLQAADRSRTR